MTAYRFLSRLFSVLHGIEAQIAAVEWDMAAEDARNLGDEARQQKSGDSQDASLWREFILHVDCLNISIRAKDGAGASASRWKRTTRSLSRAKASGNSLSATSRFSLVPVAR
jgi:hypothetical protein